MELKWNVVYSTFVCIRSKRKYVVSPPLNGKASRKAWNKHFVLTWFYIWNTKEKTWFLISMSVAWEWKAKNSSHSVTNLISLLCDKLLREGTQNTVRCIIFLGQLVFLVSLRNKCSTRFVTRLHCAQFMSNTTNPVETQKSNCYHLQLYNISMRQDGVVTLYMQYRLVCTMQYPLSPPSSEHLVTRLCCWWNCSKWD